MQETNAKIGIEWFVPKAVCRAVIPRRGAESLCALHDNEPAAFLTEIERLVSEAAGPEATMLADNETWEENGEISVMLTVM